MSDETRITIDGSVGAGGVNNSIDTCKVQFVLNEARARMGLRPIGLDGAVGPETIGAIRDFQSKSFGRADGRVDKDGRTLRRLIEVHNEPGLALPKSYVRGHRGRYQVTVGVDGRIFVRPGDWLSKYSAAIYGDYYHIYDFGRMIDGKLHLLRNPNLIRAGEVLYHLPTWQEYMRGKTKITPPSPPPLTDKQKAEISKQAIGQDFKLKGDYGIKLVDRIGTGLEWASPAVEVISWAVAALETAATAVGLVLIPLQMYGMFRDWANYSDTDLRLYSMRGAVYAITAWAFGDPIPDRSPTIRGYHELQPKTPEQMRRLDEAWRTSASEAVAAHERYAREHVAPTAPDHQRKAAWQAMLRGVGEVSKVVGPRDARGRLSVELMMQLLETALANVKPEVRNTVKSVWEDGYNTPYPQ